MRSLRFSDDSGSAAIDFIVFGVICSCAVLFSSLTIAAIQHEQLIAQQYSKQLARSIMFGDTDLSVVERNLSKAYGLEVDDLDFSVTCEPACGDLNNISPGSVIEVTTTFRNARSTYRMRAQR